jgi:hypothetical protein
MVLSNVVCLWGPEGGERVKKGWQATLTFTNPPTSSRVRLLGCTHAHSPVQSVMSVHRDM